MMMDRLQPEPTDKPMESICILCKRNLDGSSLEKHVKEVHLIGHEGALNLLLDYLRRETGCQVEEFELVRPPEEDEVHDSPPGPPSPSTSSNDEASNSAPGEPSLWLPDPMTCISAAERVKLGRRRAKEGEQVKEKRRERSRRYSTEVKTMVSSIEMDKRKDSKTRKSTEDEKVKVLSDQDVEDVITKVLEKEVSSMVEETSKEIEDQMNQLADAAYVEIEKDEISKLVEEGVEIVVNEELSKMSQKMENALEIVLAEEVNNMIEEATSTIEEVIEKAIDEAVSEALEQEVEYTVNTSTSTALLNHKLKSKAGTTEQHPPKIYVSPVTVEVPKASADAFGDDVAKIIQQIPSPLKTKDPKKESTEEGEDTKARKKDRRCNSETQKPTKEKSHSSKRKSKRFSIDEESSESWSVTVNIEEQVEQVDEAKKKESKKDSDTENKSKVKSHSSKRKTTRLSVDTESSESWSCEMNSETEPKVLEPPEEKKDLKVNSDTEKVSKVKSHSSKRKSKRFSTDKEPSESWSCTIITEEDPPQTEEELDGGAGVPEENDAKSGKTPAVKPKKSNVPTSPLLVHSTLQQAPVPDPEPKQIVVDGGNQTKTSNLAQPTVVDLTEMSQTETADMQATQALLEEISLSVFGVRFRCPLCSWTDEQVRCVRDHMSATHKGNSKAKQKSPVRQGMRVRLKHPRIHKDTLLSAVKYYKSFGGHFFASETKAAIKFWGKEIPKMKDLSSSTKVCDTPAKKKIGPKSWMIENKLLPPEPTLLETPVRAPPSRPSLKRRPKPQDLDKPAFDETESLDKIGKEILNNDISQVNLFDEIDIDVQNQLFADVDSSEIALDVQNQLFAEADSAGLFANEPSNFEENLTGLETLSVDSDFDLNDDIDTSRTRRRKSEAKKVKPIKIKKKITLTKTPKKTDPDEAEQLNQSTDPDPLPDVTKTETTRKGDLADDDDSEIENKVPTPKRKISPKKAKDGPRSRTKARRTSRLQQLNPSTFNSSRSTSRDLSDAESSRSDTPPASVSSLLSDKSDLPTAPSETESLKSLHLRLSSDAEDSDKNIDREKTPLPKAKDPESVKKSIISILSAAVKVPKKSNEKSVVDSKSPKGKRGRPKKQTKEDFITKESKDVPANDKVLDQRVPDMAASDIMKTPVKEKGKENSAEEKNTRTPRSSLTEDERKKKVGRKKYKKGGTEMEIPAELQLPEGSNRNSRSARGKKKQGEALHSLLTHLLSLLQEQDENEWFSVPINDKIAPDYSKIVKEPMDFTAMENKLDTRVYGTLDQFKYDFNLIVDNCLAYHKPDTCYYKAGNKLHHYGRQLLSKRNIKDVLDETPGVFYDLTPFELGFDPLEDNDEEEDPNTSFQEDNTNTESVTEHIVENLEGTDPQQDEVYMSAAERVKFGRRKGAAVAQVSPQKRKRTEVENSRGKRQKISQEESMSEDMTPITGEDPVPSNSLYHHDYFGYAKASTDDSTAEETDPVSRAAKEKLRNLQLQRAGGTYVQCCKETCKKWRFLTEYEDPSLVPEYWECSMNRDKKANSCRSREGGESVEEDEEYVNVAFTAGSLVWARVKGYPWWPAMVDYCPDSEEYYWIEKEESRIDPAWYHVVFLEKQVSRSWVRRELVEKMTSTSNPPKNLAMRKNSASQKGRMVHAITMATDALSLSLEERLKKYSFASLFKGKWGDYSDVSSDEGSPKKGEEKKARISKKTRPSVETPEKKAGLDSFECEKCGEKVIYSKYLVQKHVKKHRMDLKEYLGKFDPDENNEKFAVIREWIDQEEFRKAIAEDPWKPNLSEKESASDNDRLRTEEEVVVLEQSPKTYLNPAQEEEFHVQSTVCKDEEEKFTYSKPLLSNDSLIAVSVRNLDPKNQNGASFRQIVAFISLHFPFYDLNLDTCKHFVKKAYGLKNPQDEEEPTGTFRIRPAVVQRLYEDISPILQNDKAEIEKSMLHPKFLDMMVQRFLEGENYCHPKQNATLPYNLKQLSLLAFMALRHPANLEQIIIYLTFLFPAFGSQQDGFRSSFGSEVSCAVEVDRALVQGEERFSIKPDAYTEVVKTLRLLTSAKPVFEALKSAIFDEEFINVLFPGLKVTETVAQTPTNQTSPSLVTVSSSSRHQGGFVATNIVTPVQAPSPSPGLTIEVKPPIPCDILVYYIAILEEKKKMPVTSHSVVEQLKIQFDQWNNKDFRFVEKVLQTKVFNQQPDRSFQISPHVKSFGTAVLMKFIIENLDEMLVATSSPQNIQSILPRMAEGSTKLQSDFRTQTLDFSKKKCIGWRPPLPESMLLDLAILATADMNDTSSLSGAKEWVEENFPWYNLTRQKPFASIPERVKADMDPETRLSLSASEATSAKAQIQRLVISCRPQLTAIMTKPYVLNCVLDPNIALPIEDRRYTRPPFPDGVMVGLAILHIGDDFGWVSALSILKFVEINFPFYEGDTATRFLANISSWLTTKTLDAEYFKVEKEKSGIMPRYQIRSDRLLTCFAWMGKYVTFDKESEAVNQLFMKSPALLKEILSLPPPDWKEYYCPSLPPMIRATPISKMLAPLSSLTSAPSSRPILPPLPSLTTTSPIVPIANVAPMEVAWEKPPMETHLMVAMALILKDCAQFQEQVFDYAPPDDVQVSQFSLQQKNSLQQVLVFMKNAFPYYEAKENIREFVINDIQNNKDMISQFFNLNKNAANKLEYEFKAGVAAEVYEEVLGLADWSNTEAQRSWLRNPKDAETAFGGKAPLSESNILALILFLHGDSSNSYSLCVESIINVMINEVGVASHGLSGQRWGEARLRRFLRETILRLEAVGEHFHRDLANPTLHLALRTEEGRLDDLFANLQKSVFNIINKTRLTETLKQFLGKFMEMASPS